MIFLSAESEFKRKALVRIDLSKIRLENLNGSDMIKMHVMKCNYCVDFEKNTININFQYFKTYYYYSYFTNE